MKIGIGLGGFGLRAGVSTRGIGVGAGPFSVGHSWHSRRPRRISHGGSAGGGGCLTVLAALFMLAVISAFVLWPYRLGAMVAVGLGAGNPSVTRTVVGCLFEWPWLTLLIFLVVQRRWPSGGYARGVRSGPVVPRASRSPAVDSLMIAVVVSAVLVILGGVVALQPNQYTAATVAVVPTSVPNDDAAGEGTTMPPDPGRAYATPDHPLSSAARILPPVGGDDNLTTPTDQQGFVGESSARCNYTNPAVAIGRTADSHVVICETGMGRLYYKGLRVSDGTSVAIDDPVRTGSGFIVTNAGVQYTVSPTALVITSGTTQLADETMLYYWSD